MEPVPEFLGKLRKAVELETAVFEVGGMRVNNRWPDYVIDLVKNNDVWVYCPPTTEPVAMLFVVSSYLPIQVANSCLF